MNSLTIVSLVYDEQLIDRYQALSHLPGFALLQSGDKSHGRYDIVTAHHYDELTIRHDSPNIEAAFLDFENKLPKLNSTSELPFQGGAIGYISYDLGARLAGIHSVVHPILDGLPLLEMRFYDWAIISDHYTKETYLVSANQRPNTYAIVQQIIEYWQNPNTHILSSKLQSQFKPLLSARDYENAFSAIHQDLRKGRVYQVNYTQAFLAEYTGDLWALYRNVHLQNPVPYAAFLRYDDATILSFSPERFLSIDNREILTSPIKGTAKRADNLILDTKLRTMLLSSTKDRAENVMIVDLMRNDLGKIAEPGSVRVTSLCDLISFKSVHHLVSNIKASALESISPIQAVAACFPGGSITGAPKLEAMRIIAEQEPYARGVYCGSIGYFSNHGRVDTNVAIRTMTAKNNHLWMAAGGALVIDSECRSEYEECFTKIKAILSACS